MKIESAIKWLSPKTSPALIHSIEIGGGNPMKYINEAIATVERHFGKCRAAWHSRQFLPQEYIPLYGKPLLIAAAYNPSAVLC